MFRTSRNRKADLLGKFFGCKNDDDVEVISWLVTLSFFFASLTLDCQLSASSDIYKWHFFIFLFNSDTGREDDVYLENSLVSFCKTRGFSAIFNEQNRPQPRRRTRASAPQDVSDISHPQEGEEEKRMKNGVWDNVDLTELHFLSRKRLLEDYTTQKTPVHQESKGEDHFSMKKRG